MVLAVELLGAHELRRVVAGEVRARDVPVRDLSGEPLREREAHGLRDVGQEHHRSRPFISMICPRSEAESVTSTTVFSLPFESTRYCRVSTT